MCALDALWGIFSMFGTFVLGKFPNSCCVQLAPQWLSLATTKHDNYPAPHEINKQSTETVA